MGFHYILNPPRITMYGGKFNQFHTETTTGLRPLNEYFFQGINGDFLYHLSSNINVFAIDETSGVITVKDPGLLDREMTPNLQFEVSHKAL